MTEPAQIETATFAGGCFWCLEAVYELLRGVDHVESGYTGGQVPSPSYHDVCTGRTGHAEAVQIRFDPTQISYEDLLHVFFTIHDPTTLNRQGNDHGTQYRSAIYFSSPQQKETAEKVILELTNEKLWRDRIVTEVTPLADWYPAEDYHQEYFRNNPFQSYCQFVVAPKVAKARAKFVDQLKQAER